MRSGRACRRKFAREPRQPFPVMKIAVVGTGYVGLVSGTCFAETGNDVVCVDIDASKVEKMRNGEVPIYEPHLDVLFERNIKAGRLSFTTDLAEAVGPAEVIFLALPTPPGEDGSADLSYVLGVADQLGKMITEYKVIVDKSTVPVGTAEKVTAAVAAHATVDFDVVSNPEFLREGYAVDDFLKPDRVVIGVGSDRAEEVMTRLYKPFIRQGNPLIVMDERSAELTKYAANAFLATKITFINEVASLCERVGANVEDVAHGIGLDQRIGPDFLSTGPGYGGSCFPKDTLALVDTAQVEGSPVRILEAVIDVNEARKQEMAKKVIESLGGLENAKGKSVAIWGLTFKPNTDDLRDSPSIAIIPALQKAGIKIRAFDPQGMEGAAALFNDVTFETSALDAAKGADAICLVTHWPEFAEIDLKLAKTAINSPRFIDLRNVFDPAEMAAAGWEYSSLGRPT